jgi:asparagine synthase (glutamine-hydrolysing)
MTVDRDRIVVRRYWRLDPAHEIRYRHEQEYADHFFSLFEESVACRLRSDRGAVAAYLSGGVDSSSVVGMARKLVAEGRGPAVETFSMVFRDDPTADESAHIAEVERFWQLPSHRLPGALPDAAGFRDQVSSNRDVPDLPSEHLIAPLRASISSQGFRVVLTGAGGDNGFSGSLYHYADLLRQHRLLEAWSQFRADARVSDVGWSPSRIFTMGVVPLLPRWFKNAVRPLARRAGWPGGPPRWIPTSFAARVSLDDRLRVQPPEATSFANRRVRDAFENGWVGVMLEMSERSAARLGLEERHPFFDRRIMEFALAIPEMERWRGTCTKRVLRLAMKDLLPPSVRARRDKADFSVHVVRALQTLGGSDLLDHLEIASRGWVDGRRVSWMYRQMMQRFRDGDPEYTEHMFPLWMVAGVELWARTRRSCASPAPAALAAFEVAASI